MYPRILQKKNTQNTTHRKRKKFRRKRSSREQKNEQIGISCYLLSGNSWIQLESSRSAFFHLKKTTFQRRSKIKPRIPAALLSSSVVKMCPKGHLETFFPHEKSGQVCLIMRQLKDNGMSNTFKELYANQPQETCNMAHRRLQETQTHSSKRSTLLEEILRHLGYTTISKQKKRK